MSALPLFAPEAEAEGAADSGAWIDRQFARPDGSIRPRVRRSSVLSAGAGNPYEITGQILASRDALAWSAIDRTTGERCAWVQPAQRNERDPWLVRYSAAEAGDW